MNLNDDSLYTGISGAKVSIETFDLGHGIIFSQTYAHLTSPLLMAFAPAEKGKPHPTPWSAVKGGFGFDINIQLFLPKEFCPRKRFDRINTIWWLTALMRLKTSPAIFVPVISDRPFQQVPASWQTAELHQVEVNPRRMVPTKEIKSTMDESDLSWLRDNWERGGMLMAESDDFNIAFQAFDSIPNVGNAALGLIGLWGALEHLFSPAKQELRFRISASIASFLEPAGASRLRLHKRVLKLYDSRSQVAHGTGGEHAEPLIETYALMRRVILKIIEDGRVPTRDEIEKKIFGCE